MSDTFRTKLSLFRQDSKNYVRAHTWTDRGYSSKTFSNASEANAWMDLKMAGATKADQLPRSGA